LPYPTGLTNITTMQEIKGKICFQYIIP